MSCENLADDNFIKLRLGRSEFVKERMLLIVEESTSTVHFALGILHLHGSQLRAAVMDRWPSFSRSGSRKLLRFHQCLKELRQLTPAQTPHELPVPVW